ncbi:hypothetical protein KCU99_g264, partial [Aureobasidium melanogenum]
MMISASSASEVWDDRPRNIRAEVKSRSMYSLIALRRSISFTSCLLSNIVDDNTKVRSGMVVGKEGWVMQLVTSPEWLLALLSTFSGTA